MNIVAKELFEAESNTAGSTAYTTGNINKQGVVCIHSDAFFHELFLDAFCSNGIAKEQCYRVFIVYKIAGRISVRIFSAYFNSFAVIVIVFDDFCTALAKEIFFPLFRISRHMNNNMEAQSRTHDTDAHAQIAGGANLNLELAEKFLEFGRGEYGIIISQFDFAVFQCQVFRMFQYFVNAASCFDGARDCQMAVLF